MHNIDWCEGSLQLAGIATKNVGENDINTRMKYIMVSLDNWQIKIVQEGWQDKWYYAEQEFYMTRIYWVEDYTKSV